MQLDTESIGCLSLDDLFIEQRIAAKSKQEIHTGGEIAIVIKS